MAITNWSELQTALSNWLNRSDLSDRYGEFAALFEEYVNNMLRVRQMETALSLTASSATVALPSDFLAIRDVYITSPRTPLRAIGPESGEVNYDNDGGGLPTAYLISGSNLKLFPSPDGGYSIAGTYYSAIDNIEANSTNWLLTRYPSAYLYGCLVEAAKYLPDPERLAVWQQFRDAAISGIVADDKSSRWRNSAMQVVGRTP